MDLSSPKTINPSSPVLRIKSSICTTPLYRNEAFLRQKYEIEKLSARQIADAIGCSHSVVNRALNRFGITKVKQRPGWIPYGWKMVDGKRVHHIRQQRTIQQMRNWRERGWSYGKIAERMNKRGVQSPSETTVWYPATVRRILSDRPRDR